MTRVATMLFTACPFVCGFTGEESKSEFVVRSEQAMQLVVSECPVAPGAVQILPISHQTSFLEWDEIHIDETRQLILDVVHIWEQKGIKDYLIYGKATSDSEFGWEVVPYRKEGGRLWKQFKVLWNIVFGGACVSSDEREKVIEDLKKDQIERAEMIKKVTVGNDPFCDPKVIQKQLVLSGKTINVLYNYAPIAFGEEKLHFLFVPKEHRERFSDLTAEEYLESIQLSQKIIKFYQNKGYSTAYLFDKTGAEAGQTVPHWHEHLVFAATKTQDIFSKFMVLKNMLIGSSPLSQEELQGRVKRLQEELSSSIDSK